MASLVQESVCNNCSTKIDVNKPLNLSTTKVEAKGNLVEPGNKEGAAKQQFMFDITINDLDKLKEGLTNTVKNSAWALKTFEEWWVAKNNKFPVDSCPENILIKETLCGQKS